MRKEQFKIKTMRKLELELKDDFEILDDGAIYNVPTYEVTSQGLEKSGVNTITIVRGENNNQEANIGSLHEHYIKVLIHDLKQKNKMVPSRETSSTITHLEIAYNFLLQRQIDRVDRKVIGSKSK